eukprot:GFUD01067620.1.p1 GENE.GFUD01067620.1~~GFUD01067620.1.p1  ORF type:complete len:161 (+),score=57.74 GFUD01067620.1:56-538(+)
MAEAPRRSGRNAPKRIGNLTENDSESNSPNVEMEELTLEEKKDVNSKFMSNFDPTASRRMKQKVSGKTYQYSAVQGKKTAVYDHRGVIVQFGADMCDCLTPLCPGCHFPCPKCRSAKCGHECRVNRKWQYDTVELDGRLNSVRENQYLSVVKGSIATFKE